MRERVHSVAFYAVVAALAFGAVWLSMGGVLDFKAQDGHRAESIFIAAIAVGLAAYLVPAAHTWTVEIDNDGLTKTGPVLRQRIRWAEVVGYDVAGAARQGITLYKVAVRLAGSRSADALSLQILSHLRHLSLASVEGREFRSTSRWAVPGVALLAIAALVVLGGTDVGPTSAFRSGDPALVWLGVAALILAPLAWDRFTWKIVLRNGVLTQSSCFQSQSLALASVWEAKLRQRLGEGSHEYEALYLNGDIELTVPSSIEGYAMLRDAIIQALPCETVRLGAAK